MSYTFRLYTNDDSFISLIPIPIPEWVGEIQVVLAFARDYDEDNNPTNGIFKPYWDTYRATPALITQFKNKVRPFNNVKVLVSIGERNAQYPFSIEPDRHDAWVTNATESLTRIIERYKLDGIDVYYEYIESGPEDFVYCIGKLLKNLRNNGTINVASIAPTAPLNANFYFPLYQGYSNYIDTVVYQCFTQPEPINTPEDLVVIFNNITKQYHPENKLLAGYSTISRDWVTVSPDVYYTALCELLSGGTVAGPALWVISDPPGRRVTTSDSVIPSFVLERILEVVSLAWNGQGNH